MSNDSEEVRPQVVTEWAKGLSEERTALLGELIQVNRAYQTAVEKMDEAFFKFLGVNRTDGRCLDVIDQRPGITAGELATAVGLSPGAVTTALDRLEARGFVSRERDPADRRRVTLKMTPEAGRLAWEAYGPLGEMGGPFIQELSDEQLEAVIRFLRSGTEINQTRADELLRRSLS
jgi:DNA-binding MarR family transcriptional regulator